MFAFCVAEGAAAAAPDIRTAQDAHVPAAEALHMLREGNKRYLSNESRLDGAQFSQVRAALADQGQNPFAVVIGCADSRCPLEIMFDAQPGDLFVLRNAGNSCPHKEGSVVASTEFAVGALGSKLILVLGHTKCGAMVGATNTMISQLEADKASAAGAPPPTPLQQYLKDLTPAAKMAVESLPKGTPVDQIVKQATKFNVFYTIQKLKEYSAVVAGKVASGEVQIHGGIYDIVTGEVEFLGQSISLPGTFDPPIRTAKRDKVPPKEALQMLKDGNARYLTAQERPRTAYSKVRLMQSDEGQSPFAVIIGCADSRCPLEIMFDAQPGDLFVLRNAGNACPHKEGSVVASAEFAVGALGSKVIVVLGHTKCGAIAGATNVYLSKSEPDKTPLMQYLKDLTPAAKAAVEHLPAGSPVDDVVKEATKINVFNSIEKLFEYSSVVREKAASGEIELHGAIYDITTGVVSFLGQHPNAQQLARAPARAIGA